MDRKSISEREETSRTARQILALLPDIQAMFISANRITVQVRSIAELHDLAVPPEFALAVDIDEPIKLT